MAFKLYHLKSELAFYAKCTQQGNTFSELTIKTLNYCAEL